MSDKIIPSHVAILVPSVRKAADHLKQFNFNVGEEEIWDGEGTKEIYVERDKANSLLLMEPIKIGAYQRAMSKRGPGIHHFAIDVPNIEEFLASLEGSGWLVHPKSFHLLKKMPLIYLARPGFPALIEVQEQKNTLGRNLFVGKIRIPIPLPLRKLTEHIGLKEIVSPTDGEIELSLDGKAIALNNLL